ncbi:hypothetical protein BY996DRAFT_6946804 [Phakopsora pachyrhizi]|nr:hypothetical protein BY996DRAFT_6946804 [Phakopsora pachyrhizi]
MDHHNKLIKQGNLFLSFSSPSQSSKPKVGITKKKSSSNIQSYYSVLYLDGRLECYSGDPFSVGSVSEGSKPVQVLQILSSLGWISSSGSIRKPPPSSSIRAPVSLSNLGLDASAQSSTIPRDRKTIKEIFGFKAKRSRSLASVRSAASSSMQFNEVPPVPSVFLKSDNLEDTRSISNSDGVTLSGSSIYRPAESLPDTLTFLTDSAEARRKWMDAFAAVLSPVNRLSDHFPAESISTLPQAASLRSPQSLNTISTHTTESHHPSPISYNQNTVFPNRSNAKNAALRSIDSTGSLVRKLHENSSLQSDFNPPATLLHYNSGHVTEHSAHSGAESPGFESPPGLQVEPLQPLSLAPSPINSQASRAVPAWIKAVRNADEKKAEEESIQNHSETERLHSTQCESDFEVPMDRVPGTSLPMTYSFSAPSPLTPLPEKQMAFSSKALKTSQKSSLRSIGSSFVTNLRRAGSLNENGDLTMADRSSARCKEHEEDAISNHSDSTCAGSPSSTRESFGALSSEVLAKEKKHHLLHLGPGRINSGGEKASVLSKFSVPIVSQALNSVSRSASTSNSRGRANGLYNLKGPSTSSVASSSQQFRPSSRESDGQHSLYHQLTASSEADLIGGAHSVVHSKQSFMDWLVSTSTQAALQMESASLQVSPLPSKGTSSLSKHGSASYIHPGVDSFISISSNMAPGFTEHCDRFGSDTTSLVPRSEGIRICDQSPVTTPSEEVSHFSIASRSPSVDYNTGPRDRKIISSTSSNCLYQADSLRNAISGREETNKYQSHSTIPHSELYNLAEPEQLIHQKVIFPLKSPSLQSRDRGGSESLVEPGVAKSDWNGCQENMLRRKKNNHHLRSFDLNSQSKAASLPVPPSRRKNGAAVSVNNIRARSKPFSSISESRDFVEKLPRSGNSYIFNSFNTGRPSNALSSVVEGEFGNERENLHAGFYGN